MTGGPFLPLLLALTGCKDKPPEDRATEPVPWNPGHSRLDEEVRGYRYARGIIHLHSPNSHDACDGDPRPGGVPDAACLADLKAALCTTAADYAFLTDHPDNASEHPHQDLFWLEGDDEVVTEDGAAVANSMACPDGSRTLVMPGLEDELMPVGLARHVDEDPAVRSDIYNASEPETVAALTDAGAVVLVAHTEHRSVEALAPLAEAGLSGVEMFNLHAMVDPSKRVEDLGLHPSQWLTDAAPFTDPAGTGEPDLMFLAFYQEQAPSIEIWDTLSATGTTVGVAGTDAHQNVMDWNLRDGERLDSYRRMIRWFSNWLLVEDVGSPADHREALRQARSYAVFETLGTPAGLDVHATDTDGGIHEVGATLTGGTLSVTCPTLTKDSPTNTIPPDISARILKDGDLIAEGCGDHDFEGPGVYRVVFDLTPWHLEDLLGEDPTPWMRPYPWVYSNPFRIVP